MSWTISKDEILEIGNLVNTKISPFCGTVYGVYGEANKPAEYIGSGTFVRRNEKIYFLTAQHVVDCPGDYAQLFVSIDNNNIMAPSQGGWVGYEVPESDLGILECFEELYKDTEVQCLDISDISDPFLADDALFFTMGCPGELHTSLPHMRLYQSVGLPVISTFKGIIKNSNEDEVMFSISYGKDINPKGMSGAGVWNLNLHKVNSLKEWNISHITFAGVIQRWNPETNELILTNSNIVADFLSVGIDRFQKHFPRSDQ